MKTLAQVLAENGHEGDTSMLVPGLFILDHGMFGHAKLLADGRTPVSVHATREGEWLATLRLEDLLAMVPDSYGQPEES